MKIIIDASDHKEPLIYNTKDVSLIGTIIVLLRRADAELIIPDSAILAYRDNKENHYHFGGVDQHELSFLTEEVLDAIMEQLKRSAAND